MSLGALEGFKSRQGPWVGGLQGGAAVPLAYSPSLTVRCLSGQTRSVGMECCIERDVEYEMEYETEGDADRKARSRLKRNVTVANQQASPPKPAEP